MGSIHAQITFAGKRAHSARPWQGKNAIGEALPFLAQLQSFGKQSIEVQGLTFYEVMNATKLHAGIASKPSFPGPGMWLHGSNRALMRRMLAGATGLVGRNLFEHDFRVCDAYANGLQAAAQVRCPVTFVLGERDQMTSPKATRDIAAALRANIVTLPAGHSLMTEAPDGVLNAVRQALTGRPPR